MDQSLIANLIGPVLLLMWFLIYRIVSGPFRRRQSVQFFLDILEARLKEGQSPEEVVLALASTRDRFLGKRFRRIAMRVQQGMDFLSALDAEPAFMPRHVLQMLVAGKTMGDLGRVLPGCQKAVADAASSLRASINYLVLIPAFIVFAFFFGFTNLVFSRYEELFDALEVSFPWPSRLVYSGPTAVVLVWGALITFLIICGLTLSHLRTPRRLRRLGMEWLMDTVLFSFPWRRRRMLRDFSGLLASLLDAEVPEKDAVLLAAKATDNRIFVRRADKAVLDLKGGSKLPDALQRIDRSGDLKWRISNATPGKDGFSQALNGWHDLLEAKAFQQEQAAGQVISTGIVLGFGSLLALFVLATFLPLLRILSLLQGGG